MIFSNKYIFIFEELERTLCNEYQQTIAFISCSKTAFTLKLNTYEEKQ